MTSDRKLLLISFVRLLKFCKNQISKCCFFAEFKKMTSVSLWWFAVLITEMEIKFRKKVTFENWFLQYLTSLTNLLVTFFDQRSSSQKNWSHFLNSAKNQHFENWFLHNFNSLTKLICNNFRSEVIFIEKLTSFSKFRKNTTFWQLICMYFLIIFIFYFIL